MLLELGSALCYLDRAELKFDLKGQLDHSDLDVEYTMKRARNDAKLVPELTKVRTTREELREFEKDFDEQLPSRKKLKDMKNLTRELLEDPKWHTRNSKQTEIRGDRED